MLNYKRWTRGPLGRESIVAYPARLSVRISKDIYGRAAGTFKLIAVLSVLSQSERIGVF